FELFLRAHRNGGGERYRDMALHTLRQMARGGIYDQLGGGFHRYSVDQRWLVPHFEKMLYDNAQLVPLYLSAYQLAGDEFYARIARETLDYVLREMRDPTGGFYSTQDADSEGEEGRFFLWDVSEVRRLLGDDAAEVASRYWDITDDGNFERRNILHVTLEVEQLAKLFRRDVTETREVLASARQKLFAAREQRIKPARDEKILTAWNALTISAFAKAAEVLDDERYRQAAIDGVAFIESTLQRRDRLLSTCKDGVAKLNGYLDDYAFFVAALIDVFEAVQDRRYLDRAIALTDSMLAHFWDHAAGGLFFTSDDHEELILRSKPAFDGSIPSGNSVAAQDLVRLHHYTEDARYLDRAEALFSLYASQMAQQPFGFANMLCAVDYNTQHPHEIVLVGPSDERQLLPQIRRTYVPNRTLTVVDPHQTSSLPPLLEGKGQIDGKPTVYICRNRTCSAPATEWAEVEPLLRP
ncbi:MAG TPA: thioredoxin domain-containing protein, partial [Pseudomonadales bacterium]|nr:thioredoxin domain-containing protein [Pseudomonadales bacterium]